MKIQNNLVAMSDEEFDQYLKNRQRDVHIRRALLIAAGFVFATLIYGAFMGVFATFVV